MSFTGLNSRGQLTRRSYARTPEDAWLIPKKTDTKLLGPTLPSGREWTKETKKWYEEIRKSDIAQVYTDVEWQQVYLAAVLHNDIFSGTLPRREQQTFQTELRQQLAALLLTPESRKRNKVVFVDPEPLVVEPPRINNPKQDYRAMFANEEMVSV